MCEPVDQADSSDPADRDGLLEHLEALPAQMEISYPAGRLATLIRDEVRRRLDQPDINWVGTERAATLLEKPARQVRRLAAKWHRQWKDDSRPEVRVRKQTPDKKNSPWEFADRDLWRLRRQRRTPPARPPRADGSGAGDRLSTDGASAPATDGSSEPTSIDEGLEAVGIG